MQVTKALLGDWDFQDLSDFFGQTYSKVKSKRLNNTQKMKHMKTLITTMETKVETLAKIKLGMPESDRQHRCFLRAKENVGKLTELILRAKNLVKSLLPGWEEFTSSHPRRTGKVYYFNKNTGKSQWGRPGHYSEMEEFLRKVYHDFHLGPAGVFTIPQMSCNQPLDVGQTMKEVLGVNFRPVLNSKQLRMLERHENMPGTNPTSEIDYRISACRQSRYKITSLLPSLRNPKGIEIMKKVKTEYNLRTSELKRCDLC